MIDVNLKIALNDIIGKGSNVTTELSDEEIAMLPVDLDLSNRNIQYLDGLARATHLESLNLTQNNIRTADELDKISSLNIHTINLTNFTSGTGGPANATSELRVRNFNNLKNINIDSINRNIKNVTFMNLPKVETLIFNGKISENSGTGATLQIENLPLLRDVDFGSVDTLYTYTPENIILKDLPEFTMKSHIINKLSDDIYHWYLGVNARQLKSIQLINLPKVKYFDTMEVYDETLGDDVIPVKDTAEFLRPINLREATFINLSNVIEIDLTNNPLPTPVFEGLDSLETLILKDTRLKSFAAFEALKDSHNLEYIDFSSTSRSGIYKNAIVSIAEMDYIKDVPAKKINFTNTFATTVKDFIVEDFPYLEEIIIEPQQVQHINNYEFRNLERLESLNFVGAIHTSSSSKGHFIIENMPSLKHINLGHGSFTGLYYASPKELVLRNLPQLETKSHKTYGSTYQWYWGINPQYLQSLVIEDVDLITAFDVTKIPESMKTDEDGTKSIARSGLLTDITLNNNEKLEIVNVSKQKLTSPVFSNLPALDELVVSENAISTLAGFSNLIDSPLITELDFTKNKISSSDELKYIEQLPITTLILIEAFALDVDELVVENFEYLDNLVIVEPKNIVISNPKPIQVSSLTMRNLPAYKNIDFTLNFTRDNTASGTLILENMENLETAKFGGVRGQTQYMSPRKLILKDLPKLKVQSYMTINQYNWYLGIGPNNLEEIIVDNVGDFKEFDTETIPEVMNGQGTNRNTADFSDMLRKVSFNNVGQLERINIPKKQLLKAHFTNLEDLKELDVSAVFSEGHGTLEDLYIENTPLLQSLNFDNNLVKYISFLEAIVSNSTSPSLHIEGNKNHIYDATPVALNRNNLNVSLKDQTPALPNVYNNVGATGVYDFDTSVGTFNSPHDVTYTDISHGGTANGSRISFRDLEYQDPTSFNFKWLSEHEDTLKNGNFIFSGHAVQSLNYPLESFEGSLNANKERSFYTDEIEYTLTFTPLGMDQLPVYDAEILLPIPDYTSYVDQSLTISDNDVTLSFDENTHSLAFDALKVNQEYTVTYKVKVNTQDIGVNIKATAVIGNESYAQLDLAADPVVTVLSYQIKEQFVDRNNDPISNEVDKYLAEGSDYIGSHTDIANYVYIGYQIDDEEQVLSQTYPQLNSLSNNHVIKYIYGVEDPDNPTFELIHTVTEQYVNRNNAPLAEEKVSSVYSTVAHPLTIKDIEDYIYVGYILNDGELKTDPLELNRVVADTKITYVYGFEDPNNIGHEAEVTIFESYRDRKNREITTADETVLKYHESFTRSDIPTVNGYVYLGYRLNDESLQTVGLPSFTDLQNNQTIEYVFGYEDSNQIGEELIVKVSEKHVNRKLESIHADTYQDIYGKTDYEGEALDINGYVYVGYIIDDVFTETSEMPVLTDLVEDKQVMYVYGVEDDQNPGQEKTYTIQEKYVDRDFDELVSGSEKTVFELTDYVGSQKAITNYLYIGYQIDDQAPVYSTDLPNILRVTKDSTVSYIYAYENPDQPGIELEHTITETYVNRNREELIGNKVQTIYSHTRFVGNHQTISNYNYLGYSINGGQFKTGVLDIKPVTEDLDIVYLYGYQDKEDPTQEQKVLITETFVDRKNRALKTEVKTEKFYHETYTLDNPYEIEGYILLGYRIDSVFTEGSQLSLTNLKDDVSIEYVYGVLDDNTGTELHHDISLNYVDRNGTTIMAKETVSIPSRTDYLGVLRNKTDYIYVGYKINDGLLLETKTDVPEIVDISEDITITYVYGVQDPEDTSKELTYKVNETYVNRNNDELASENIQEIYATTRFEGLIKDISDYVYLAYSIDGADFVFEPLVIESLNTDMNVVYLYGYRDQEDPDTEQELTITENYVDRKGRVLKPQQIQKYFYHETYELTESPHVNNFVYLGYIIESKHIVEGLPRLTDMKKDTVITYVFGYEDTENPSFELELTIEEKYVNRKKDEIESSEQSSVFGLTDFQSQQKQIANYVYVGYIIDDVFTNADEAPLLIDVLEDIVIIHVYGVEDSDNPGYEKTFKITEEYVNRNDEILEESETTIAQYDTYEGQLKQFNDYVFVGYILDDTFHAEDEAPTLEEVEGDHTITYIYGVSDKDNPGEELIHTVTQDYETRKGLSLDDKKLVNVYSTTAYQGLEHLIDDYVYVDYRIDGGELIETSELPYIERVTDDMHITYVYGLDDGFGQEKTYVIVEQFMDTHQRVIQAENVKDVIHMEDYYGEYTAIEKHQYIGYIIDNQDLVRSNEMPSLKDVVSEHTITYVYENLEPGQIHIEEHYVDTNGNVISPMTITYIEEFKDYTKTAQTISNYKYLGYRIDGNALKEGDVSLLEVSETHTIEFVYDLENTTPPTGIESPVMILNVILLVSSFFVLILLKKRRYKA